MPAFGSVNIALSVCLPVDSVSWNVCASVKLVTDFLRWREFNAVADGPLMRARLDLGRLARVLARPVGTCLIRCLPRHFMLLTFA
jgi:hypothetical protein